VNPNCTQQGRARLLSEVALGAILRLLPASAATPSDLRHVVARTQHIEQLPRLGRRFCLFPAVWMIF
jgi:hypothetical protein